MIREPSRLIEARRALEKAEEDLGDPQRLSYLKSATTSLVQIISGSSPQIERDIAKRMVLTCREKILSKVKAVLANRDLCEISTLEHWNRVMEMFVVAGLAGDESFEASKRELLVRRQTERADNSTAGRAPVVRTRESEAASTRSDFQSRAIKEPQTVRHAVSLRTLGQSLEKLRLQTFRLQKKGDSYRIQSESLTATRQWILRNFLAEIISEVTISNQKSTQLNGGDGWLCYGPLDIERLNALEQKQRPNSVGQVHTVGKLAQLLHALGEHLDSKQATNYEISWAPDSVSLVYQTPKGLNERKVFSVGTLQQLALFSKFQKSTRSE
jgi:hypothetical protein